MTDDKKFWANAQRLHFIGIGGTGMSPIAKLCLEQGREVSGSDMKESANTIRLKTLGAKLFYEHKDTNIHRIDAVIVSSAIDPENPELMEAQSRNIPVIQRGQALAYLMAEFPKRVVVAGTHGKTTTTGMLAHAMTAMRLQPTYLVGATVMNSGINANLGKSHYFVTESDESDGSFMCLSPNVAIVTNIEPEHLTHYGGSFETLCDSFRQFMADTVSRNGKLIVNADDDEVMALAAEFPVESVITFGMEREAMIRATQIEQSAMGSRYQLHVKGDVVGAVSLQLLGRHNVANSLAAMGVALSEGVSVSEFSVALGQFSGVSRRFEKLVERDGICVYDDYAHHPTEILTTLSGIKAAGYARVICVFQPHRYSRTLQLLDEFGECFAPADWVIITDIYAASEKNETEATGQLVVDKIQAKPSQKIEYMAQKSQIPSHLIGELRRGDLVITMGAGDITTTGKALANEIKAKLPVSDP